MNKAPQDTRVVVGYVRRRRFFCVSPAIEESRLRCRRDLHEELG